MTLMGDKMVRGAPANIKENACATKAYELYDLLTRNGCPKEYPPEGCKKLFEQAIVALNIGLALCEPPEGNSTLCRVQKPGFFSFVSCRSVVQVAVITKEECQVESKKDFTFHAAGKSQTTYYASEAFCIDSPMFLVNKRKFLKHSHVYLCCCNIHCNYYLHPES
ncbi:hypothetical protein BD408DRAFT_104245 [Parasitella parasitica]|nr:hypothetical protein BD408DRAFT_104245 [Parasitella parasitica]